MRLLGKINQNLRDKNTIKNIMEFRQPEGHKCEEQKSILSHSVGW